VVRWYTRKIPIDDSDADSLPWAVVKGFCGAVISDVKAKSDLKNRCVELLSSEANELYRHPRVLSFADATRRDGRCLIDGPGTIWGTMKGPIATVFSATRRATLGIRKAVRGSGQNCLRVNSSLPFRQVPSSERDLHAVPSHQPAGK